MLFSGNQVYALSFDDNRYSFSIVVYDSNGKIFKNFEKMGARYIKAISLDLSKSVVIFTGQSNYKVTVNIDFLKAPPVITTTGPSGRHGMN